MTDQEKLDSLYDTLYQPLGRFSLEAWCTPEPVPFDQKETGRHLSSLHPGDRWGKGWDCAWIKLTADLPDNQNGDLVLLLDVGGEACLYDEGGRPLCGFTNVQSEFTVALGKPGKVCMFLPVGDAKRVTFWADCGANDLFGAKPENGVFVRAEFARCDKEKRGLYFDLDVLLSLASTGNAEAKRLFDAHIGAENIPEARREIGAFLQSGVPSEQTVYAIGNAHIDLAWLWPMRETRRKAVRTLATVCRLMEHYPDYRFSVSQPQMLVWVKEDAPELYARVCSLMRAGRIELLGGMWVEPDTNLPSGESLVRQLLYGIGESETVYGEKQTVLCLPDSFGFCGQLPQLIRQAGLSGFLTTKLSWNGVNKFPYKSFRWRGIDGSEVVSHIPPEGNYNSGAWPASVAKAKGDGSDPSALLYGIGDGGGGPGMEHLERVAREAHLPGFPTVRNGSVREFFEDLKTREASLPLWQGELYLEKHQGVYTTFGKLKTAMCECEQALYEAELLAAIALRVRGDAFPLQKCRKKLETLWKAVLLRQFHDILPGSCMPRAMEEELAECVRLADEAGRFAEELRETLLLPSGETETVWNTKPCGENALSILPYAEQKNAPTEQGETFMQNEFLRVDFGKDGSISQITDRKTGESFLRAPAEVRFYEDNENAWEIPDVKRKPYAVWTAEPTMQNGAARAFRLTNGAYAATVLVRLNAGAKRVEFTFTAENFPLHTLAKWVFPLRHRSDFARCGIQFGELSRPTTANHSHDSAMKEVCFQNFVDISDAECGAALLASDRHGVSLFDCEMGLSLLRTPDYPAYTDPNGTVSAFAFFPHGKDADLPAEAADYTVPPVICKGTPALSGKLFDVSPLVVSCVKPAEREDGAIVLRCFNPKNAFVKASLAFHDGLGIREVFRTDLLEDSPVPVDPKCVEAAPFEIITLLLK